MTVGELLAELQKHDKSLEVEITIYRGNGDMLGCLHDYIAVSVDTKGEPKRLNIFGEED